MNPSASTRTLAINGVTVGDDENQVIQAFEARGIEASPAPEPAALYIGLPVQSHRHIR